MCPPKPSSQIHENQGAEKAIAWVMVALAASLGGLSMVAFTVFLFAGPLELIELGLGQWGGMATNAGLSLLFFFQHSGMVRQPFKRWLADFVPEHYIGAIFSIASGTVLLSVVLVWQESDQVVVIATGVWWWIARALFFLAIGGVLWGTLSLRGFDSLGLGPIKNRFRASAQKPSRLAVRGPYRWMRHPLYFFVLLMIWSYPYLTVDRALFNVLWTLWIAIGSVLEERDLIAEFGDRYRVYQCNVPMLIPNRISGWIDP
ncbi:MAG: isoprenylcysteine carboxylmethyltransferase family protein, partial [Gammaproteobacteria bacterium]|nr:isoprenylcysteine carboxylmethyltransferase family protein [Gammaproteobacteria bacterium]